MLRTSSMPGRTSDNKEGSAVAIAALATAAVACVCGGLVHVVFRQRQRLTSTEERLGSTQANLADTSARLNKVEKDLRTSQDENDALRGELGVSRSQGILMRRELSSSERRLEGLAKQLERQKRESREHYMDGVWDEE